MPRRGRSHQHRDRHELVNTDVAGVEGSALPRLRPALSGFQLVAIRLAPAHERNSNGQQNHRPSGKRRDRPRDRV